MPHNHIFKSDQVTITDSAVTLFDTSMADGREYYGFVKNIGSEDVYIGCATVTDSCGFQLSTDEKLEIKFLDNTDVLNAICATGESTSVCWFLAA